MLFTNDTAGDIDRCTERIEPFLTCLSYRDKLAQLVLVECVPCLQRHIQDAEDTRAEPSVS